ncbi:MAG: deoxyribose-phosphate aldolase [Saprospiraceae bacterium]
MNLAASIDHTLLRPNSTLSEIARLCEEAKEYSFAAVCVSPYFVKRSVDFLADSPVKVTTVIGFPNGYSTTAAKVEEIKRALNDGADEVDVVINVSAVKDKNWHYVANDIESTTMAVHLRGKVIKIILETGLLEKEEVLRLCQICEKAGVNYVKTSTGFNGEGATVEIVKLLRQNLSEDIRIKASAGIRSAQTATKLLEAGASRLGTSASIAIMSQLSS